MYNLIVDIGVESLFFQFMSHNCALVIRFTWVQIIIRKYQCTLDISAILEFR